MKDNVYRVYGDIYSGNCYKIKLLMRLLGIEHEWIHVDIMQGESRSKEFLAMNPNGKVPVVRLPDGRYLFESNHFELPGRRHGLPARYALRKSAGIASSVIAIPLPIYRFMPIPTSLTRAASIC